MPEPLRLLAVLSLFVPCGFPSRAAAAPPNVVHILIDDMGCADLGCYGNASARTPHIDRLAREGLRFANFYTNSPICSPSRTAWMTGQYPARHRILSYLAKREENAKRGMPNWLDPGAWTVAGAFRSAGYATGHFGKWHMGGQRDVREAPLISEYGFDQSLTNFEGLGDRVLPLLNRFDGNEPKRYSLGSEELGRGKITWLDRDRVTGAFVSAAIAFMDQADESNRPFLINLWPDDVHSPFLPSESQAALKGKRRRYLAVLEDMDRQLGVLFDSIRNDAALRKNTVIILTSDNGPEPGAGSAEPYRGAKGQLWEGGIRAPLIVWAPGLMESTALGSTNESSWFTSVDVVRSLLPLAGAQPPEMTLLDGEEVSSTLLGRDERSRSAPAFWVRPPDRPGPPDAPFPDLAVRRGSWKLLVMQDGSAAQLFNLASDPTESKNVAAAHPEATAELKGLAVDWFNGVFQGSFPKTPE